MPNRDKLVLLTVLAIFPVTCAICARADSISLGSFATGTSAASLGFTSSQTAMNFAGFTGFTAPPATPTTPLLLNGTASTYALAPASVWANPTGNSTWVGYSPTAGPGGVDPAYGYYQFTTSFTAAGGADYAGMLNLMADDTAEVLLNGSVIVPFGTLGNDVHCAATGPGCTAADAIALAGITLYTGPDANSFTFVVMQAGNEAPGLDPSGVNFTANLVSAVAPEPGSLVLLGTGLIAGAGLVYLRRRSVAQPVSLGVAREPAGDDGAV